MLFQDFAPAYLTDFKPYCSVNLCIRKMSFLEACLVWCWWTFEIKLKKITKINVYLRSWALLSFKKCSWFFWVSIFEVVWELILNDRTFSLIIVTKTKWRSCSCSVKFKQSRNTRKSEFPWRLKEIIFSMESGSHYHSNIVFASKSVCVFLEDALQMWRANLASLWFTNLLCESELAPFQSYFQKVKLFSYYVPW